ncbi:DUF2515 family protein [Mangrovibacillus sp. Mu-81]|uniref:DUF2515 family protein n=1 Tax=Mangrovibacillus sp. Mu-81 TaxID=3121478 RepID=UPI002FE4F0C7
MDEFDDAYRLIPYISDIKRSSDLIDTIRCLILRHNQDNITRTIAYQKFYILHPEIKWTFLASMVSRNAGWNMTDLESDTFKILLPDETRKNLFMTYERANWSIFQDAYPQLLIYHYSTLFKENMFHLLKDFHVSSFMQNEWEKFWADRNEERLVQSLIINEQNLIQRPVIEHPVYKKKVFRSGLFFIEDHLHFCSVVFPTVKGKLIGASVHDFRKLNERIRLGKILFQLLFHRDHHSSFREFAMKVTPTGSRSDYEYYCDPSMVRTHTPPLSSVYKKVNHHWDMESDWSSYTTVESDWYEKPIMPKDPCMAKWFSHKQKQLKKAAWLKSLVMVNN